MEPSAPPRTGWRVLAAWAPAWLALAALAQMLTRVPFDADTSYHLAVAQLMARHGPFLKSFPWTPFSWLADHYADKELLFHLLLLPVANLPPPIASMIAGTVFGALALAALHAVLRAERVPRAEIWVLALLTVSGLFLYRFILVRPHLLSIALAILVGWAAARRRHVVLGVACFLYPLAYVGWSAALVLVVLAEIATLLGGNRPRFASFGAAVLGLSAGLLVHPNFPDNLRFAWTQIYDVLFVTAWQARTGFDLGSEFQAPGLGGVLRFVLLPGALAVAALLQGFRARREDPLPLALGSMACAYLVMTLRTERFMEYLAPFAVAAAAVAFAKRWPPLGTAVAGVGAATLLAVGSGPLTLVMERIASMAPETASRLRAEVPEGAQVFTCGWGETGELMLALPERRFLVALDPVFFHKKDADLYRLWYGTVHQPPARPAEIVRDRFGASFALCDAAPAYQPFIQAMAADPEARLVFRSFRWFLFRVDRP